MTDKRSFEQLSDVEKDALRKLYEAKGVTSTGPCDLARSITGNRKLQASDPRSTVFTDLIREKWIVIRHEDHREKICRYGVADDYLALQLA